MLPIVVFGTGGFGREVHELIEDINDREPTFEMVGFLDGNAELHGQLVHDLPVLGDHRWLKDNPGVVVAVSVGNPAVKRRLVEALGESGAVFPTLVHPRAELGRRVELGEGSIICMGNLVTTDVVIESFVTLNFHSTIGHDTTIRQYATLAPGAHISGNVEIGEGSNVGTGATVIQGLTIGQWSVIGANASVVRDLPSNVTAVGVPAKVIKVRDPGWHLL